MPSAPASTPAIARDDDIKCREWLRVVFIDRDSSLDLGYRLLCDLYARVYFYTTHSGSLIWQNTSQMAHDDLIEECAITAETLELDINLQAAILALFGSLPTSIAGIRDASDIWQPDEGVRAEFNEIFGVLLHSFAFAYPLQDAVSYQQRVMRILRLSGHNEFKIQLLGLAKLVWPNVNPPSIPPNLVIFQHEFAAHLLHKREIETARKVIAPLREQYEREARDDTPIRSPMTTNAELSPAQYQGKGKTAVRDSPVLPQGYDAMPKVDVSAEQPDDSDKTPVATGSNTTLPVVPTSIDLTEGQDDDERHDTPGPSGSSNIPATIADAIDLTAEEDESEDDEEVRIDINKIKVPSFRWSDDARRAPFVMEAEFGMNDKVNQENRELVFSTIFDQEMRRSGKIMLKGTARWRKNIGGMFKERHLDHKQHIWGRFIAEKNATVKCQAWVDMRVRIKQAMNDLGL